MSKLAIPFVTHAPSEADIAKFRLAMSTFRDGSGQERESDGTTRPGWRELERIVVEVLEGVGSENKAVFDVLITPPGSVFDIGVSVKSKSLSESAFKKLKTTGRVYMELCNSPAKLWGPIKLLGHSEGEFSRMQHSQAIGDSVVRTVESWHTQANSSHQVQTGRSIDLAKSVFLTITYGPFSGSNHRSYQFHSFDLEFRTGIKWRYKSDRCLSGYDPEFPNEVLMDWYGLSGGQLKYYPRASNSRFHSPVFTLFRPQALKILEKAKAMFPDEWQQLIGN